MYVVVQGSAHAPRSTDQPRSSFGARSTGTVAPSVPGIGVRVEESVLVGAGAAFGVVALFGVAVPLLDIEPVLGIGAAFGVVALLPAAGVVVVFIGADGFVLGMVSAGMVMVPEVDGRTVGSVVWA